MREGWRAPARPFVSVAFSYAFQRVPGGLSNCPEPANTKKWKEPERPLAPALFLFWALRPGSARRQNDFSDVRALLDPPVCVRGLRQGECAVDENFHLT